MSKVHTKQPRRQMPVPMKIGQGILNAAFTIWTVRDIRRRSDDEIKGNRKVWLAAAFASPVGPIAYFLLGRKRDVHNDAQVIEDQPAIQAGLRGEK